MEDGMVQWGNTQSIFQITLALNLAYFSLREIRAPTFARHEIELANAQRAGAGVLALLAEIHEDPRDPFNPIRLGYEATLRMHERNLAGYERPFDYDTARWEARVRYFALAAAGLSLGLLFYGTLHSDHEMRAALLWLLTAVCLMPPALFLLYNLVISNLARRATREILEIGTEITRIRNEIVTTHLPDLRRRQQEQAARRPNTP
jgi:hypothetical protein